MLLFNQQRMVLRYWRIMIQMKSSGQQMGVVNPSLNKKNSYK